MLNPSALVEQGGRAGDRQPADLMAKLNRGRGNFQ